ncbi:hypothetical protein CTEN210_18110 [Chaetoceros tenuissimus]|uniref:G-protein coupled receptors family 1 profile domain-containing protein n=1 Tax=Chaetoceros tenuissimus TaxID=426638 RepID=A0AAD3DFD2_9STRA|nr:hypothetical protein CTEN210_18110 [Chaetoceros tenuissimus]
MNTRSLKAAQIIKCINASISCIASSVLMAMILTERTRSGLASPYSRIIFALSIADILFSFTTLISPFASAKENPDALFAIGSFKSCEAIGFVHIVAITCLVYYTVFLTYYFLKRIKYKMTPRDFAQKEEKFFHVVFIVIACSLAIFSLVSESINPLINGSICSIGGSYPEGCGLSVESPLCERGSPNKTKLLTLIGGIILGSAFLALVVILYLFTRHVYQQERELEIPARGIGRQTTRRHHSNEDHQEDIPGPDDESEQKEKNNFVLTKQAFYQSLLYVSSFLLVYLPMMIAMMQNVSGQNASDSEWRFWLDTIIPLGGVFNILIYTRPKVLKLQEQFPMLMKWELFLIVLMKGGETPSMADVRAAMDLANAEMIQEQGFEEDHHEQRESNLLSYDLDVSRESEFISSVYQTRSSFWMRG